MSKKIGRITMLAVALWFLSGASVWSLPEPMLLTEKEMAEVVGRHLPAAPKSGEWCTEYDGCELIGNTYWFVDGGARHYYCDTTKALLTIAWSSSALVVGSATARPIRTAASVTRGGNPALQRSRSS